MSEKSIPVAVPVDPITLDDIRHKALRLRTEVKDEAKRVVEARRTRIVVGGIVVVAVAFGVAYFLGSMAGRAKSAASDPGVPGYY